MVNVTTKKPDDYVVGTGKTYTIKEFAKKAFEVLDLDYKKYVKINKVFFRPSEVDLLVADSSKIKNKIGWEPKTNIDSLINRMVINDYNYMKKK